jgi:hypothetical protein
MHVLLRNAIDYAGLFPPAGLDMNSAVKNFATYLAGEEAWALGRFVVPVSRLSELEPAAQPLLPQGPGASVWQLAALSGPDLTTDLRIIDDFNRRMASSGLGKVVIDSLETKVEAADRIENTMHRVPADLQAYIELPVSRDPTPLLSAMSGSRLRAKVRTGGVTPDAFPDPDELIRFMNACVQSRVPFKATAGLHHPLRAEYRLTYAPDSVRGPMYGFLNVFLAAAFLGAGIRQTEALEVLKEESSAALIVDDDGVRWGNHRLEVGDLRRARRDVITSFGSCSFTEPVAELRALHLLEPRVQQA